MSNDRYANIRKALAMGPAAGPWSEYANHRRRPYIAGADGSLIAFIESDDDVEDANAAHIAACDPDTIRALLAERDQLATALDALQAEVERLQSDTSFATAISSLRREKERAERLAEALRAERRWWVDRKADAIREQVGGLTRGDPGAIARCDAAIQRIDALLREQEEGRG